MSIISRISEAISKKSITADQVIGNKEVLGQVLSVYGLELTDDKQHIGIKLPGTNKDGISYHPIDFRSITGENDAFFDWWSKSAYIDVRADEASRKKRYDDYTFMKENSAECSLAIETYVEESLASSPSNEDFITLEVHKDGNLNKELTDYTNLEFKKTKLLSNSEIILENLATYGDHFVNITKVADGSLTLYVGTKPSDYRRVNFPETDIPKNFISTAKGGEKPKYPWEVLHFKILTSDASFYPYGKSLIEKMRPSYKQLLINESILALSRASKIERLVVYIPVAGTSPEATFTKLMQSRAGIKNAIFGDSGSVKTKSRPTALTEVLFMPSSTKGEGEYRLDRVGSSIDISSIDDVNYFLDKMYVSSRIPASYFKSGQEGQYNGFKKLQLLDLKFARVIVKIQKSFAAGCVNLGQLILAYGSKWEDGLEVKAKYIPASVIDNSAVDALNNGINVTTSFLTGLMQTTGMTQVSKELVITSLKGFISNISPEILKAVDIALTNFAAAQTQQSEQPEGMESVALNTKKTIKTLNEFKSISNLYEYISSKDMSIFPSSEPQLKLITEQLRSI